MRVAINGFGRIGRSVYRIFTQLPGTEIVAINDLTNPSILRYLLQYDTVMRKYPHPIEVKDGYLLTKGQKTKVLSCKDPATLPWKELNIDLVIESTGRFLTRADLQKHIDAGAPKVLLTVPPKDSIDAMIVMGVNDDSLSPNHKIVSNASCTTNCLSPVMKILNDQFHVKRAFMNTIHAYTNDQRVQDDAHKDMRRARSALNNMILTTTGAAKSVGKVIPELAGKLDGVSLRVPVIDGSMVDLTCWVSQETTSEEVNNAFKSAAQGALKGIMAYSEDPLVSSDIIHDTHSTIIDGELTQVLNGKMIKVIAWYDNEWGYSNRVVDLARKMVG